jgi:hypothetical protein
MPGRREDEGLVATLRETYYGGSVSDLAAALGTSRDTARNWSSAEPRRPRRSTLVRVRLLFGLCRAAERYMATSRQVGEWTLAPHPAFAGMSPAQALADEGFAAYRQLRNELVDYIPARPDLPIEFDESSLLADIAALQGEEAIAELQKIIAAPELKVNDDDLADLDDFDQAEAERANEGTSDRIVAPNLVRGGWDVLGASARRASAHTATKAEAERRARAIVRKAGGGKVWIHDRDGEPIGAKEVTGARNEGKRHAVGKGAKRRRRKGAGLRS